MCEGAARPGDILQRTFIYIQFSLQVESHFVVHFVSALAFQCQTDKKTTEEVVRNKLDTLLFSRGSSVQMFKCSNDQVIVIAMFS